MPECASCSGFVTSRYVRVFGVGGTVSACPACSTISDRADGEGAIGNAPPSVRWGR